MAHERHPTQNSDTCWSTLRHRLRLECRECEIICERVVYPWHCLKSSCRYVYVFEEGDTTYFGCLHKVFSAELDIGAFTDVRSGRKRVADPYGPLRVMRSPRRECQVAVEQAYAAAMPVTGCCNPTFFQHPAGPSHEMIRLITNISPERD